MLIPRLSASFFASLALYSLTATSAFADTSTLSFSLGVIRDRSGNPVAADTSLGSNNGTVGILVASASGNFSGGTDLLGSTLSAGNALGSGDNKIVSTFHAQLVPFNPTVNPQTDTLFASSDITIDTTVYASGTKLQVYWFPGITTDGTTLSAASLLPLSAANLFYYGAYRNDAVDVYSTIGFFVPTANSSDTINIYDTTAMLALLGDATGGLTTQTNLTALQTIAVPEPSTVAALLLGGGCLMTGALARRRKL